MHARTRGTQRAEDPFAVDLSVDIWREACRHLDMVESLANMLPIVSRHLPVGAMIVRRVDLARGRVDTVAAEGPLANAVSQAPFELDSAGIARVARAFGGHAPWIASLELDDPLFGQNAARGDVLVAPLFEDGSPAGLLGWIATARSSFEAADVQRATALIEPFAMALANDRRVHELAQLREAALAENRALLTRLSRQNIVETVVGEHGGLRPIMERVEQVARTDVPVLVLGETGSGKEVVARALHERSRRSAGPMVRVNCGAIPTELVDSELFGHERGSFTGAVSARRGWFERADGGTLLLDEIGELPLAAQVRLLRVLSEGTLERVGAQRTIHVDVRIVAATHRDLAKMVVDGTFREDLWYRLSVFPVRLPPLRERLGDLPALAAHFAARTGERLGGAALVPTPHDIELLSAYPWPGNVRELAAVIERAAILGGGTHLDIARSLGDRPPVTRRLAVAPPPMPTGSLEMVNREAIHDALARARGRIEGSEGAAALLGIHPATLRSRMRKLGIEWQRWRER
jgi:hydrogenase-4 transcriptional activator